MGAGGGRGLGGSDRPGQGGEPFGVGAAAQLGELVALLGPRVLHDVRAQAAQTGQEAGGLGVHAVEAGEGFLGLLLLGQAVGHHLLAAVEQAAGVGVHDFLFGRFVHGQQPDQAAERVPPAVAGGAFHLVEEVADVAVLAHQQGHDVVLAG